MGACTAPGFTGSGRAVSYALHRPVGQPHRKGLELLVTVVIFPVTAAGLCPAARVPPDVEKPNPHPTANASQ